MLFEIIPYYMYYTVSYKVFQSNIIYSIRRLIASAELRKQKNEVIITFDYCSQKKYEEENTKKGAS